MVIFSNALGVGTVSPASGVGASSFNMRSIFLPGFSAIHAMMAAGRSARMVSFGKE